MAAAFQQPSGGGGASTAAAPRPLLFYSNYCAYCTHVLTTLGKQSARDALVLVCVDNNRHLIPPFIASVPAIVTLDRRLLQDDDVMRFVEAMCAPRHEVGALDSAAGPGSDAFAYLDDAQPPGGAVDGAQQHFGHNFVPVDYNPRIYAPKDHEADAKEGGKGGGGGRGGGMRGGGMGGGGMGGGGGSALESLVQQRDMEFAALKAAIPRGVGA